jgi:hypothetical protein
MGPNQLLQTLGGCKNYTMAEMRLLEASNDLLMQSPRPLLIKCVYLGRTGMAHKLSPVVLHRGPPYAQRLVSCGPKLALCSRGTQVDWLWLIFPAVLLALTLFLLVIIALRTMLGHGNVPMWKSSILPLMFANAGSFHARSGDLGDIDDTAEQTFVKLQQKGDNWEFTRPDGAMSSGSDANDPVRHERRNHHDWPGPSTSAFL